MRKNQGRKPRYIRRGKGRLAEVDTLLHSLLLSGIMAVKVYHDSEADLSIIQSKRVTFVGYGNQGKAGERRITLGNTSLPIHILVCYKVVLKHETCEILASRI